MSELKLGIITDLEGNTKNLAKILKKFKDNIDVLVLSGDIPSSKKNSMKNILNKCLKLKIKIILIPGSHENYKMYNPIKNKLIIDGTKKSKIIINSFHFVLVPGSDSLSKGAQYVLLNSKINLKKHLNWRKENITHFITTKVYPTYISKIKKLINNPKKTIIISHIPPKFNRKNSIDVAVFGKPIKNFTIKKQHLKNLNGEVEKVFKKGTIFELEVAKKLVKFGYPVKILEKNVGNKHLKKLIKDKKIKKLICGHIHESGGKANDSKGKIVPQNRFSNEFFYNIGEADKGIAGIVTLKGDKAKYKKIKV